MSVKMCSTRNYDNNLALPLRQNKPKTNPIAEKPKINVNSILTKDYENDTAFKLLENKPNTKPS